MCVSEKVCGAELIKPALGMPRLPCSSFCLSAFLPLVFVFNLVWRLVFETVCILRACFGSAESFCLPWMHRIRWSPCCGCLRVDGRQAAVVEGSQQRVFISLCGVSSEGRQESPSVWYV